MPVVNSTLVEITNKCNININGEMVKIIVHNTCKSEQLTSSDF